ncbi:unnamed protein product, partial [Meganyctiphanes norvegica]
SISWPATRPTIAEVIMESNSTFVYEYGPLYALRSNFYLLTPKETYVPDLKSSPNVIDTAVPIMLLFMAIEAIVMLAKGRTDWHLHQVVVNYSTGGLTESWKTFFFRGVELQAYIWVFDNWCIYKLPWDSPYVYIIAALGVDFCVYIWHRACHEISFMWAFHYPHHSAEEINISVGTRVSLTMRLVKWVYFLPLALLGLPPATMMIHVQLGLIVGNLYHCELIPKLSKVIPGIGHVMEFIFNTPSHHRVHHGANKYCIDKNHGGWLIIWDRMFGTFQEEKEDEKITYGTISQKPTYHIVFLQFVPMVELYNRIQSQATLGDKVRTFFYGPGWCPGDKHRLGDRDAIPDVRGRSFHEVKLPIWLSTYMVVHCFLVFFAYLEMVPRLNHVGTWLPLVTLFYITLAYVSLGGLYDGSQYAIWLEPARLLTFLGLAYRFPMFASPTVLYYACWIKVTGLLLWPAVAIYTYKRGKLGKTSKVE